MSKIASRTAIALTLTLLAGTAVAEPQPSLDGQSFDPGAGMSQRAEGAPAELDAMRYLLGSWDVTWRRMAEKGATAEGGGSTMRGRAEITYMNRGHAYLERSHSPDFDGQGHELHGLGFLAYAAGNKLWSLGRGETHSRGIQIFSGGLEGENLVLLDGERRLGSGPLLLTRLTFRPGGEGAFEVVREISDDRGKSWRKTLIKSYRRSERPLAPGLGYGKPAPGEASEARQFDFLIGTFDARQQFTFANGKTVKFPSFATAVHTLGGHGIFEFNWHGNDPNLPDAATSILRLYNPAMRRWESLFLSNRGSSMLHFGGRKEGERIVLHRFVADLADAAFGFFVFHDIEKAGYKWYAESTTDHGKTFVKNWIIEMSRKTEGSP